MTNHSNDSATSLEDLWKRSRAGARASAGFRFQDAAATAAAVFCWSGRIVGHAIVPESLDDFSIESANRTVFVQVKSKISDHSTFTATEIVAALAEGHAIQSSAANFIIRTILIDRAFAGQLHDNWNQTINDNPTLAGQLRPALKDPTVPQPK